MGQMEISGTGHLGEFSDRVSKTELARQFAESQIESGILLDLYPIGLIIQSLDEILHANREACRLLGCSRDQLVGKSLLDFLGDREALKVRSAFVEQLSNPGCQRLQDLELFGMEDHRMSTRIDLTIGTIPSSQDNHLQVLLSPAQEVGEAAEDQDQKLAVSPSWTEQGERKDHFLERLGLMGSWHWDRLKDDMHWSSELKRIFERTGTSSDPSWESLRGNVHEEDMANLMSKQARLMEEGGMFTAEYRVCRQDGSFHWMSETTESITGPSGQVVGLRGVIQDVTERKQREEQISRQAYYDPLTDLPNRLVVHDRLTELCAQTPRQGHKIYAMQIVVDDYKRVRDALGLQTSDQLIKVISARLRSCVPDNALLARLEGVEFLALLEDVRELEDVKACIHRIQAMFSIPLSLESKRLNLTTSIGVASFPDDGDTADALLRYVDTATTVAATGSQRSKNSYSLFKPNMAEDITRRLDMESHLWNGLHNNEFQVHFQPQMKMSTGKVCGAEALMRWNSPHLGWVSPGEFIPVAEETGMIIEIGKWVIEESCRFARECVRLGARDFQIGINVSPVQFQDESLPDHISDCLARYSLSPQCLEVEITEGVLIDPSLNADQILPRIKEIGVHLSLDDFGTGYSSISYLQRMKFDTLKIDQSFVRDICTDSDTRVIVRSIVAMAKRLSMSVITEGVEDEAQYQLLQSFSCDKSQGFFHARPMEVSKFLELYREEFSQMAKDQD